MTIKLEESYVGRATAASPGYPGGSFKNESTEGADDGTPFEKDWPNDSIGFVDAIFERAGIEKNGTVDTAIDSQAMRALLRVINEKGTQSPNATPADICSGMNSHEWWDPAYSPNVCSTGLGYIQDSCMCYDAESESYFLAVVGDDDEVYPITGMGTYGLPIKGTALALVFPATPDKVMSVCCDGVSLFVAWAETGGTIMVSSFPLDDLTDAEWTVDTGQDYTAASHDEGVKIAIAGTTKQYVTILIPDALILGAAGQGVGVITIATQVYEEGFGSYAGGAGVHQWPSVIRPVSDGTHVYRILYNPGSPNSTFYLMSAKLTDPATSDHATVEIGEYVNANAYTHPRALLRVGDMIIAGTPAGYLSIYSTTDKDLYPAVKVTPNQAPVYPGVQGMSLGSDGLNVWMNMVLSDSNNTRTSVFFCRIPIAYFCRRIYASGYDVIAPVQCIHVDHGSDDYTTGTQPDYNGRLLSDISDMYFVGNDGVIFRIANVSSR